MLAFLSNGEVVLTEDTARPLCLHLPCFGLDTSRVVLVHCMWFQLAKSCYAGAFLVAWFGCLHFAHCFSTDAAGTAGGAIFLLGEVYLKLLPPCKCVFALSILQLAVVLKEGT